MQSKLDNIMRAEYLKVIEHMDYMATCNLTNEQLQKIYNSYSDVYALKALAIAFNTLRQIVNGIGIEGKDKLFFDQVYWRSFTPARRQVILQELTDYVEALNK